MRALIASLAGLIVLAALAALLPRLVEGQPGDADPAIASADRQAIGALLDGFHAAAARADAGDYFGRFAPRATFVGTDPAEVWDLAAFRAYARPHFEAGRGWEYRPTDRLLQPLGPDAIGFHEALESTEYGRMRGSGAVVRGADGWRVALYVLSFAVPNDRAAAVVEQLDTAPEASSPVGGRSRDHP